MHDLIEALEKATAHSKAMKLASEKTSTARKQQQIRQWD